MNYTCTIILSIITESVDTTALSALESNKKLHLALPFSRSDPEFIEKIDLSKNNSDFAKDKKLMSRYFI